MPGPGGGGARAAELKGLLDRRRLLGLTSLGGVLLGLAGRAAPVEASSLAEGSGTILQRVALRGDLSRPATGILGSGQRQILYPRCVILLLFGCC